VTGDMDRFEELERLGQLRATGRITELQFSRRKAELLSATPSSAAPATRKWRVIGSIAAIAATLAATYWISGNTRREPDVKMQADTAADDAATTTPIDPDADVWTATLDNTREGQVCAIKMQGMPAGESIEFDFYTESDEGLTELYVVGPVIKTSGSGSVPVNATLTFGNGAEFKGTGTIENTSSALQSRGASALGSSYTGVNGGIDFYKALQASEYLNYVNERGDKFYIDLIGRNDLLNELRECLGRTEGVKAKNAAQ
jgi:hypothetical protein